MFELKNGRGKGKEYDENGEIKFIGEYLNGERNGYGIEYNFHNELIYKGEFLNGKRNGKGKEYSYLGRLLFDGEYLNGEKLNVKEKKYYDFCHLMYNSFE